MQSQANATPATPKTSVVFERVSKQYGGVVAVREVSFDILAGQLVTLLGPSGCGKTTTLRLIAGLEYPSSGRILIGGVDVTDLSATYRNISMVFQSYALFPHMTVIDNVAYGLVVKGAHRREAHDKAMEALAMVGLAGFGPRLPSELSGGQQQRVAVARAAILEPEVLLLDEPLSNLDAKLRRHVREEIRNLQQKLGLTAVYVTHDQEEAMAVSDRIIVMNCAEIAQQGTPRDLYDRPGSPFIADFIGDANVVPCNIIAVEQGAATIQVAAATLNVACEAPRVGDAKLAVRPRAIRLVHPDKSTGLLGEVVYAAYLGDQIQYTVATSFGELFAIDTGMAEAFPAGATVAIDLDRRGLAVLPI